MNHYFIKLENNHSRPFLRFLHQWGKRLGIASWQNRGGHGFEGWLDTVGPVLQNAFVSRQMARLVGRFTLYGLRQSGWLDRRKRMISAFDVNDRRVQRTAGFGRLSATVSPNGVRSTPRGLFLATRARLPQGQLDIRSDAPVERVLVIEGDTSPKAIGVRLTSRRPFTGDPIFKTKSWADEITVVEHLYAQKEVIMSAGTLETPAILLRSNIGPTPREPETNENQPRWIDLPKVGTTLNDRYEFCCVYKLPRDLGIGERVGSLKDIDNNSEFHRWKRGDRTSLFASTPIQLGIQVRSNVKEETDAGGLHDPIDLFIGLVTARFQGFMPGYSDRLFEQETATILVLHENKTDTRGRITLDPADPLRPPHVEFQYFVPGADKRKPLIRGIEIARTIMRVGEAGKDPSVMQRFADWWFGGPLAVEEEVPGLHRQEDAELGEAIDQFTFGHHANGSCRLAKTRADGVVDRDLRVFGVERLRIVDASVLPLSIGSFILSAVYVVAEKAGVEIDLAPPEQRDPISPRGPNPRNHLR